jgi:hypothetical protein
MIVRVALAAFIASCLGIAGAYALAFLPGGAPGWAAWGVALGGPGTLAAVMLLGAARRGRVRPIVGVAIGLTFVVLAGAFALALLLPAVEGAGGPLLLGLPLRTAVVIYGVGIVPMFFLPAAYAAAFDAETLTAEDLQRVRADAASRVA